MHNELFSIGPITIYGYGLMIGIGVLAALMYGAWQAKVKKLSLDVVASLGILCVVLGFAGAKLLYILTDFATFLNDPIGQLAGQGFVVYGGVIGGAVAAYVYCRVKKVDFWQYFDLLLPGVALAQGFGRIGCLLAGCCYGMETDGPLYIVFHSSSFAPNDAHLFPTQIISSIGMFLIALFLHLYSKRAKHVGNVGAMYLILYSIGRFGIEFFRNDFRGEIGIFSTSQFISLFVVILGFAIFYNHKLPFYKKRMAVVPDPVAIEKEGD